MRLYKFLLESNTPEKPKEFVLRIHNSRKVQIDFLDSKTNTWYVFFCSNEDIDAGIWIIWFREKVDVDAKYLEKKTKDFSSVWKHIMYFIIDFIKTNEPNVIRFTNATNRLFKLYSSSGFKAWFNKQTGYIFDEKASMFTFRRN